MQNPEKYGRALFRGGAGAFYELWIMQVSKHSDLANDRLLVNLSPLFPRLGTLKSVKVASEYSSSRLRRAYTPRRTF